MGRIEKSIEIKAPPGGVWEMLALDRLAEWMDEFKSAKYTTEVRTHEDKYRVGASAHIAEKEGEYDFTITESVKNEKITARSKGKFVYTASYIMTSIEGGTKLTYVMVYDMPWGALGRTIDRAFGEKHAGKWIEKSLENLKNMMEK